MTARASTFSLRLRDPRLRELVREVASHEGVSQNEVIEHAILEEMIAKGRLLAADLQRAADRLSRLSQEVYRELVVRSLHDFAEGEARPEPLAARSLHDDKLAKPVEREDGAPAWASSDELGVLAAFETSYR